MTPHQTSSKQAVSAAVNVNQETRALGISDEIWLGVSLAAETAASLWLYEEVVSYDPLTYEDDSERQRGWYEKLWDSIFN